MSLRPSIEVNKPWHTLRNHFILNGVRTAALNLLADNEGTHQEQLAHTLLGDLSPHGAYPNPQLHEQSGDKEFIDVVLTYELGTVLLESKTLSIFEHRTTLPDRTKLRKNIEKSANRGLNQLATAVRKLRESTPVYDRAGNSLMLERTYPPHAILLVPDLDLLTANNDEWILKTAEFFSDTDSILHILDTAQLFRVMQAAHMISNVLGNLTPMMAFDQQLKRRAIAVFESNAINLDMRISIQR